MKVIQTDISKIKIGHRHRKDMGDLRALAASIDEVGQFQPIGVTPKMELVFGERRVLAHKILGKPTIAARIVDIPSIVLGEYHENFGRKEFTPSELVAIVETMRGYTHGGDRKSDQSRNSDDDLLTADEAAKLVGLARDSYFRAQKVIEKGVPELVAAMDSGKLSIFAASELADAGPADQRACLTDGTDEKRWTARAIRKRVKQAERLRERREKLAQAVDSAVVPDSIRLHHCRFQELESIAAIRSGTAALLKTDIPYDKGFLPQVSELGAFAARVLMDGGLLVMYCGQYWLPEVMRRLGEHLTYRWTAASVWDGDANLIHPLDLTSQWKPVSIYSKGPWRKRGRWGDVFRVGSKEKGWHDWQQPIAEVGRLVRYFSEPGELVIDPCAGGFSTAAACFRWGRHFCGCDIDGESVELGRRRMAEEVAERHLLLEELAVWIDDARETGENQDYVESVWTECTGYDLEYLTFNIALLPKKAQAAWNSLR